MRIIDKKEFYKLPKGTLYSDYDHVFFEDLKIKGETIYSKENPIDFYYEDLIGNIMCNNSDEYNEIPFESHKNKTSFELDFNCYERDGLYQENQMFAVYDKKDLIGLIQKLESII